MKTPAPRQLPSGRWFIQLRLDGKSISITDEDEEKCIAKALAIKKGVLEPQEAPNKTRLRDAMQNYIDAKSSVLSASTVQGYHEVLKLRFQPYLDKRLCDLTPQMLQRMINEEARLVSPKTVKNSWGLVSATLKYYNIFNMNVKLPQTPKKTRPFLDYDEILIFSAAVRNRAVAIPAYLALHSLRRSEMLGLTWDSIDFKRKTITVSGAAVYGLNHELVYQETNKNSASARTLPIMIPALIELLQAVPDKTGHIIKTNPNNLLRDVNAVCRKAGLPEVGVHGLRHSYASLAKHIGMSDLEAARTGGWSDLNTMRKIYQHISDKDVARHQNAMAEFFAGIR